MSTASLAHEHDKQETETPQPLYPVGAIPFVPASGPLGHADMTLMAFSCTNIDQPEKSWSVQIMANGDVELSPDFTFTEAARQFWAAVEFKGKSLLRRAEDAEARLQALEGK